MLLAFTIIIINLACSNRSLFLFTITSHLFKIFHAKFHIDENSNTHICNSNWERNKDERFRFTITNKNKPPHLI